MENFTEINNFINRLSTISTSACVTTNYVVFYIFRPMCGNFFHFSLDIWWLYHIFAFERVLLRCLLLREPQFDGDNKKTSYLL